MKVQDFIIGIVSMLAIVAVGMVVGLNKKVSDIKVTSTSQIDLRLKQDSLSIIEIKQSIDSLQIADKVFAKSIVYLDSCSQAKTSKVERAEKRGRFIGGLLKGLFPGL